MERLHDKIFEFKPDTLVAIRKIYNLDKPGQMDEAIDLLDAWIKKQSHFSRKDFSREYLERVIILLKGSVERGKSQMEKICTLRTLIPHFFDKFDAKNDLKNLTGYMYSALLPKLTKDHYRIYMMKYESGKPYTPKLLSEMYLFIVIVCEYLKAHDYSNGLIIVADFRNINITDFIAQLNFTELRRFVTIVMEGYGTRVKNFFFISTSKAIEVLMKIFKQMVSGKLAKRIEVLKNIEELQEYIPKELLPSDYGGDEKPLSMLNDGFLEVLCSEENIKYLKEISQARTDESMRTSLKMHEDFLELAGTFRTLNVD